MNTSKHPLMYQRTAGILLLIGLVLYVLPSALHGNPPIDDAEATLEYVSQRQWWTVVHFANIAAVVLWAAAVVLLHVAGILAPARGAIAKVVWSIAGGAFSIYFGIHAVGLAAAAQQLETVEPTTVMERTEALLLTLGSAAFVSQALLGAAIAVLGLAMLRAQPYLKILGSIGMVTGTGWLVGALMLNFAVIVPFTVLAWLWITILALTLLPKTSKRFRHST